MAWIYQVPLEEAAGALKQEYDKSMKRAGRIWNIVGIMSLNPTVMRASMQQYLAIMYSESPLSRFQRELLATVVSAELKCHY